MDVSRVASKMMLTALSLARVFCSANEIVQGCSAHLLSEQGRNARRTQCETDLELSLRAAVLAIRSISNSSTCGWITQPAESALTLTRRGRRSCPSAPRSRAAQPIASRREGRREGRAHCARQAGCTPSPTVQLYGAARPGCAMQGMAHGAVWVTGRPVQLPCHVRCVCIHWKCTAALCWMGYRAAHLTTPSRCVHTLTRRFPHGWPLRVLRGMLEPDLSLFVSLDHCLSEPQCSLDVFLKAALPLANASRTRTCSEAQRTTLSL